MKGQEKEVKGGQEKMSTRSPMQGDRNPGGRAQRESG